MKRPRVLSALLVLLSAGAEARAMEPTEVDGPVTVEVDRSDPVWTVKVTNLSDRKLSYEMIGKVPRGLGLEVWDDEGRIFKVHAEDLAEVLNVDGFPADIREIEAGKSEIFRLNPASVSATHDRPLENWKRYWRGGFGECRVVFGRYSSPVFRIEKAPKQAGGGDVPETTEGAEVPEPEAGSGEAFGVRFRKMLEEKGLALVDYNYGTNNGKDRQISYITCARKEFEALRPWDDVTAIQMPLNALVAKAHEIARRTDRNCWFEGLMMNPCRDDESRFYLSAYFDAESIRTYDSITVHLLLNGAEATRAELGLTKEEYEELEKEGVPIPRKPAR